MKKLLFIISILFILTGCKNNEYYIETFSEKKDNILITITYPVTNIKKLDKMINTYIDEKKELAINNSELNIDYTFNVISNRYLNITLETYINNNNNINHDIETFIFDKKKNNFLYLNDIVSKNSIETINKAINKKIAQNITYNYVTFDENNLYFYFNNNGIEKVNIPINDTEFLLDITFDNKIPKENKIFKKNKEIDISKPVVALTFDDGPSKYTDDILDILNENDICATFFVLGNKVKYYSNTLNKMLNSGNEIGNHTFNHKSLNRLKVDEMLYQINTTQDIIYEYTNYTPRYLRPSYGNMNKILKEKTPLEIVLWNVDPEDWKYKNSKTIANKVIDKVKDESIVLLHDTKKRTVEALPTIIKELKKKGYQFVTISELKEIQKLRKKIDNDE